MKTSTICPKRIGRLLLLNWKLNQASERQWLFINIPVSGLISGFISSLNTSLAYAFFTIALALPILRILKFHYGFGWQSTQHYRMLPASQADKFICQIVYSLGIGTVYSLLSLLAIFFFNHLIYLIHPYNHIITSEMFSLYCEVMSQFMALGIPVKGYWFLPVFVYILLHGIFIGICSAYNRYFLVIGYLVVGYGWAPLAQQIHRLPDVQTFVYAHAYLIGIALILLCIFVFWWAYLSFGRIDYRASQQ